MNNGSVAIHIKRDYRIATFEPIVLDVNNVSISNVRIIRALNETSLEEIELDFDSEYGPDNTTFVVTLGKAVAEEKDLKVVLSMDFKSQITDTLQGVYKTSYINVDTGKQE